MSGISESDEAKLIRRMQARDALDRMTPEDEANAPNPPGLGDPVPPGGGDGGDGSSGTAGADEGGPGGGGGAPSIDETAEIVSLLRALQDEMREVNVKLDSLPQDMAEAFGANVG